MKDFMKSLKSLSSESYSTVNTPTQFAAVEAYEGNYENYKLKVRGILNAVGTYVYNNLKSNKVLINPPQGAFYLMPEFLNKKFNSSSMLCDEILAKLNIALLPGSDFGFDEKRMITRLSFTDFDGENFMNNIKLDTDIKDENIKLYAPKVVEGVNKLKSWVEN